MGNLSKMCAGILIIITIFFSAGVLYSDDSNRELRTFRGTVTEIDWVGSLLTVEGGDEMTFLVPPGTKIVSGIEKITLSNIEQSDNVLVKYYDDPSGTPKAVSITIEGAYPSF